jgi:esterase/lipase superfamily enzyme
VARSVTLFFGTDRAPDGREALRFGIAPGELAVGTARVSVPLDRVAAHRHAARPAESRLARRPPAPARDIFVERCSRWERCTGTTPSARSCADSTRSVLVFVHGFATPFEQALRRAAQLAADLPFEGDAGVQLALARRGGPPGVLP